ncbi:hypothetical protein E4U50_002792 [Claviceps purpurea]|nr:hypothetical protein E4U50_002792 [Claviceps purpurea]
MIVGGFWVPAERKRSEKRLSEGTNWPRSTAEDEKGLVLLGTLMTTHCDGPVDADLMQVAAASCKSRSVVVGLGGSKIGMFQ